MLIDQVLQLVIDCMRDFSPTIYQTGSIAYGGYRPGWSDLDLVVIVDCAYAEIQDSVQQLLVRINSSYRGLNAGGGDSVVDIVPVSRCELDCVAGYPFFDPMKFDLYGKLYEVVQHGALVYGDDVRDWVASKFKTSQQVHSVACSYVQPILERITLFHPICSGLPLKQYPLSHYAPNGKYKWLPSLVINMARSVLLLLYGEYANKSDWLMKFRERYPNLLPSTWELADHLRNAWNNQPSLVRLVSTLAHQLPQIIDWFLRETNGSYNMQDMLLFRGWKPWQRRPGDAEQLHDLIDYSRLAANPQQEVAFAERGGQISSVSVYHYTPDSLVIDEIQAPTASEEQSMLYFIWKRAIHKGKVHVLDANLNPIRWLIR